MRFRAWQVWLVALGLVLNLNPGASWAADTLKIGVLSTFKTPAGESLLYGAKMAAQDINAQGGIMGKQIELVIANDENTPEKGANAYKKLVLQDGCQVVIGTVNSGIAAAIMDQMAKYKKLFISTGTASEALAAKYAERKDAMKYWFRVMHESRENTEALEHFIMDVPVKKMGAKRIAIMAENALWTRGMVKESEEFFKNNGLEVVYNEFFDSETKDFTPIFTKIMNAKPDFIYEISAHVDGAIYIKQWYDLKGPMIGGVSGTGVSDRYWKDCNGKAAWEVLIATGSFRAALTPNSIDFYDRYVKFASEAPGYPSGYTYDALHLYKLAVEAAKSDDPDKLVPVLEKIDYTGVACRYVFTDTHNTRFGEGYRIFPMVQWREDGSRVVVWPASLATGEFLTPPWLKK